MIRLSGCVLWEAQRDGAFTYVSENAEGMLGYPAEQWIEEDDFWIHHVHPADREVASVERAEAWAAGVPYEFDYRMLDIDGHEVYVRETGAPRHDSSIDSGYRGVLQNVAPIKHALRRLAVKDATAQILAHSESLEQAAEGVLRMACEALDWRWGAVWMVDDSGEVLRYAASYAAPGVRAETIERDSVERTFAPGEGLPGRVWESHEAVWLPDVSEDENFPRADAARPLGLRTAFGFVIPLGTRVLGVIEFFSTEIRKPDAELLQMMANVGSQIGQFAARKRIEQELRASEEQYRGLAEALPAMVAISHPDGTLTYVNRRWTDYTGMTLEELNAKGRSALMHPDDAERIEPERAESMRKGVAFELDYRVRRADGNYCWHVWRELPIRDAHGRIARWLGTTTDIDERKRAEDAHEFLGEATALLASSLDYETTLRSVSHLVVPRLADLCAIDVFDQGGQSRRIESAAKDPEHAQLLAGIHIRDWPLHAGGEQRVADAIIAGQSVFLPDIAAWRREINRDGNAVQFAKLQAQSMIVVPLRARNATVGVLSLVIADRPQRYNRTDLELAEELGRRAGIAVDNARLFDEAQRIADELRVANAAKDEFLGLVSHELRTPITTIFGNAQVLRQRSVHLDEETRTIALADIEQEAERLHRIIENMLVLARAESQPVQTEPLLLPRAIKRVVEMHQHRYPDREIQIDCPSDLPPAAAEPTYFEQVLSNLLNNAEKYSPAGRPIEVHAAQVGNEMEIVVLDRGKGITEEESETIFNAFYRSSRTSAEASGTGIGLAVCKRLVSAQNGRIWARPRDGGGTEVGFALPAESDREGETS